ncbi:MAG: S-layer homology domain-containing protein [Oscillospiraceae bacterium]|nr:S-layer homology domain-containing protein [Oscillospiraceae bacterium]
MKLRRTWGVVLAVIMAVSLAVGSVSAATMNDIASHWAKDDIQYLVDKGIVEGYSDGSFRPDNKMTTCEALLFCSRTTGLSSTAKASIAADWNATLQSILPDTFYSWAADEMAVCLETGIISLAELQTLCNGDQLGKSITREETVRYLTRAMQLAPLAESLSSYDLTFVDTSAISPSLQRYVYVLSNYEIIKGNDKNYFLPADSLTRAEMATMLRRALDFMSEQGITVELSEYTTYAWTGGVITSVTDGSSDSTLLTLENEFSGEKTISVPSTAPIYQYNIPAASNNVLKEGQYVRVNFASASGGAVAGVRIGGTLTSYSGSVADIDTRTVSVSLSTGGVAQYNIDRFTEVKVGSTVGDYSLIDPDTDYANVVCQVDAMGHLAMLQLSGGTTRVEGIIGTTTTTTDGQSVQVTSKRGVTVRYTLTSDSTVTINGASGTFSSSYAGKYITLRISNDTGLVTTASIDTASQYIQGSLKSVSTSKSTVSVTNRSTGTSTTYDVNSSALYSYEDESCALKDLSTNTFVTVRLSGGEVMQIDSYKAASEVSGTITAIQYGTTTTIDVKTDDESVVSLTIDMTDLPDITRDDKSSTIDKLRTGDTVLVTLRYNQVTDIEATSQSANFTGTVTTITLTTEGVTMEVKLSSGETETYNLTSNISVTQGNSTVNIYSLKPNDKISMVINGGEINSIVIDKAAVSNSQISGTVLYTNTSSKTILLQVTDNTGSDSVVTVDASDAQYLTTSGGSFSFSKLVVGDEIQAYGSYDNATFVATMVVRL